MIDLPPDLVAGPEDRAEAEAVAARIGGQGSVAAALGRDLAEGVKGRDILLTATGEASRLAAEYWVAAIRAAGAVAYETNGGLGVDVARIHLHDEVGTPLGYSPGDPSTELVGEVIGQGTSAAARYKSLVVVAEAFVTELGRPINSQKSKTV